MDKLLVIGILGLLLVGCVCIICNIVNEKPITYEKIDTGFTPEQTWDIINGADVGIVINEGIEESG